MLLPLPNFVNDNCISKRMNLVENQWWRVIITRFRVFLLVQVSLFKRDVSYISQEQNATKFVFIVNNTVVISLEWVHRSWKNAINNNKRN